MNERLKRTIKYFALIFILSFALLFFAIILDYAPSIEKQYNYIDNIKSEIPVGEIVSEVLVSQSFNSDEENLLGFSLQLATYARENTSTLIIKLIDATTNKTIETWNLKGIDIQDNTYKDLIFSNPLNNVKDHTFIIQISSIDATYGNAITIWSSSEDYYTNGSLFINDIKQNGDISFKVYSIKKDYSNIIFMYINYVILVIFTLLLVRYKLLRHLYSNLIKKVVCTFEYIKLNKSAFFSLIFPLIYSVLIEYFVSYKIIGVANSLGIYFNIYRWSFIFAILLLSYFFLLMKNSIGKKPEIIFLAISLIIGTLFSFVLPINTFVSWDDETHFQRVIETSYIDDDVNLTNAENQMIRRSMPITFSLDEVKQQHNLLNYQYDYELSNSFEKSFSSSYQYICYLPSSIALFISRMFKINFTIRFILGRWTNVLVYTIVNYFAIKKLKSGKMILSVIALFPTNIFLSSVYSYDTWVTSFVILGMSYLLSELQQPNKKVTLHECIIMIGSFVIGLGPKAIYFPMLLLLLLIREDKFKDTKSYRNYKVTILIALFLVIGSFMLPFFIKGSGISDLRGGNDVNATAQVKYIIQNPLDYTKILLKFLKGYLSLEQSNGFMTFFAYLGYSKYHMLLLILLSVVIFTDKNEYDLCISYKNVKLPIFLLLFITVSLVATSMYIIFTPVSLNTINGCQPRYIIPLLFPFLSIIGGNRIFNNSNKTYYNLIIFTICIYILFSGIWYNCISYYY